MAQLSDRIGQFVTVPHSFIDAPELTTPARWLFVVLRLYTHGETGVAFPSIDTLSARAGMKRHTVIRAIRELIDAGWMIRIKRYGRTPLYVLQLPNPSSSAQNGTSAQSGTISSAGNGTISSAQSGTLSRVRELDRTIKTEKEAASAAAAVPESAPSLSAIPEDMRAQKAPPRRKPDYFGWQVVKSYLDATGRKWIAKADADFLNENVSDALKFAGVAAEWIARGYNPTNFAGLVDVYHNGWRPTPTARKTEPAGDKFEAAMELIRGRSEVTL